ncbi:MAG: extracellular solute-binding protein [Nocardioidaceae bacterium]
MSARPRRDRRTHLTGPLAAVLLVGVVTGACTSSSDPEPSPSANPTSAPTSASTTAGPVTLRFATYGEPAVLAAYREIAKTYTTEHPDVIVKVEAAADGVSSADDVDRGFDAGTPPDLFLTRQTDLASLMAQDRVQPVDVLLEKLGVQFGDNFQRIGLEAFAGDSALQCMPNEVSPYVVYYNKRLVVPRTFGQPGQTPPSPERGWRWDQFVAAAKSASTGGVKGLYLPPRLSTLIPLVRSAGQDLMDDDRLPTTLKFADDATRPVLEEILSIARDPVITPTARQLTRQDAVTRFENGRIAMMVDTRSLVPRLRENVDLHFDVFPLPSLGRARTVADMTGYCVAKGTEHLPQAIDFLAYASGDAAAKVLASSGSVVPANLAALHSSEFLDPSRFPRNSAVFDSVIRRADPMPSAQGWPDVVSQTQPLVDLMFYSPVIDLDSLLPRVDEVSAGLLVPPTPSASASPSS